MNKKKARIIKNVLESLLTIASVILLSLCVLDYFCEEFTFNKTLGIMVSGILIIIYFIVDWDKLK